MVIWVIHKAYTVCFISFETSKNMSTPMASPPPPATITGATTLIRMESNLNPLTLEDKDVLRLVYDCHVVTKDDKEIFDPEALFANIVSDVFVRSLRTCDPNIEFDLPMVQKTTAQVEPPTDLFKRLACQMRDTKREDDNHTNAHEKTMWVLKSLGSYSWCAKAVTALAAFGLEFGIFWDIYEHKRISADTKDSLRYSLAVLNNVNVLEQQRERDILRYNRVVKNVYETVRYIVDLERFLKTYEDKNVPALEEAMHNYPAFVYWTVLAIVVLASQLDVVAGAPMYNLTDISTKISSVHLQLKDYKKMIDHLADAEKWNWPYEMKKSDPDTDTLQLSTSAMARSKKQYSPSGQSTNTASSQPLPPQTMDKISEAIFHLQGTVLKMMENQNRIAQQLEDLMPKVDKIISALFD